MKLQMPELPEVEALRLSLLPVLIGRTIEKIFVAKPKLVSSHKTQRSEDLDKLNDFVNLLEENSFEFEWMEFTANVHRSFFINGNLIDTVISDETMKQFQKTNEEILLPLIDEHIKKIYQYIQFENNID